MRSRPRCPAFAAKRPAGRTGGVAPGVEETPGVGPPADRDGGPAVGAGAPDPQGCLERAWPWGAVPPPRARKIARSSASGAGAESDCCNPARGQGQIRRCERRWHEPAPPRRSRRRRANRRRPGLSDGPAAYLPGAARAPLSASPSSCAGPESQAHQPGRLDGRIRRSGCSSHGAPQACAGRSGPSVSRRARTVTSTLGGRRGEAEPAPPNPSVEPARLVPQLLTGLRSRTGARRRADLSSCRPREGGGGRVAQPWAATVCSPAPGSTRWSWLVPPLLAAPDLPLSPGRVSAIGSASAPEALERAISLARGP